MRNIILGALLLGVLLMLPVVSGQACSVLTNNGWEPDSDCDSVPDAYDNCLWDTNVQQRDMNRNSVGDLCDLIIEHVVVEPDNHLRQGEFAKLSVKIINNRDGPVQDVTISVNGASLDLFAKQEVPSVPTQGTANLDFWLRLPKCASTGQHTLRITSVFTEPYTKDKVTEIFSQKLFVEPGDNCGLDDGPLDTTIIDLFGKIDMDQGQDKLIPIKITNLGEDQVTYHVAVENIGDIGDWRIDPAASMELPAGHDGTLILYLDLQDDAPAGDKELRITITSDDQQTSVPVTLHVRAPYEQAKTSGAFIVNLLIFLIVMLFIGILFLVVLLHLTRRHRARVESKDAKKQKSTRKSVKKRKTVAVEPVKKRRRKTYY